MKFERGIIKISHIIYIIIAAAAFVGFFNYALVLNSINFIISLLTPFFGGLMIAVCIDILGKRLRKCFFSKSKSKHIQLISTLISILIILVVLITILIILIPQLTNSTSRFINLFPTYYGDFKVWAIDIVNRFGLDPNTFNNFVFNYNDLFNQISSFITTNGNDIFSFASGAFSVLFTTFLMIVFALYIVFDKEASILAYKKFIYAIFRKDVAEFINEITYMSVKSFDNFLSGQLLNGLFVALSTYAVLLLFGIPYSLLVATITGVFCIIPVIGPLIALIPSAFILLVADPSGFVVYAIASIVISQISGNIVFPKIMSEKSNLPGILVLLSITVFGNIFGLIGMLLAIPFTSIAYSLYVNYIDHRLKKKNLDHKLNSLK
ncbi:MAG: AI-2E family transporter [Erysipelotrichaceae bacterium]